METLIVLVVVYLIVKSQNKQINSTIIEEVTDEFYAFLNGLTGGYNPAKFEIESRKFYYKIIEVKGHVEKVHKPESSGSYYIEIIPYRRNAKFSVWCPSVEYAKNFDKGQEVTIRCVLMVAVSTYGYSFSFNPYNTNKMKKR